ncbi:hypothetical protein DMI79_07465 [Akkermansia muciniphila]|nr:hypothetical protein DMI79_07465 [Akkermansia muciniphila]
MASVGTAYFFSCRCLVFDPSGPPQGVFLRQQSRSGIIPERLWMFRRGGLSGVGAPSLCFLSC